MSPDLLAYIESCTTAAHRAIQHLSGLRVIYEGNPAAGADAIAEAENAVERALGDLHGVLAANLTGGRVRI